MLSYLPCDTVIILTSCGPVDKAESTVKNLGQLVGITSFKAVMNVTEELFHLVINSDGE